MMGRRLLPIRVTALAELLTTTRAGESITIKGLPKDAKIVKIVPATEQGWLFLIVQSKRYKRLRNFADLKVCVSVIVKRHWERFKKA